jgi:hypothetical protein
VVTLLFVLVLTGDLLTGGGAWMRQAAPAPQMLEGDAAPAVSEVAVQLEAETVERSEQEKGLSGSPSVEAPAPELAQQSTPAVSGTPQPDPRGGKGETAEVVAAAPKKATEGDTTPDDRAIASKAAPDDGTAQVAVEKVVETDRTTEPPASPPARLAATPEAERVTPAADETVQAVAPEAIAQPTDALTAPPAQIEGTTEATPPPADLTDVPVPPPTPSRGFHIPRGVLRGAEIGLAVLLVGLIAWVVILRRR